SGSSSALPTWMVARSLNPYICNRWRAISADASESSTAVTWAPARAKLTVSVPMPHPISSTRLPDQRENSAKPGICASTKYLRCSTSSKYSRVPTALGECRMLQGRAFQKLRTASIGTSANGWSASMVCRRPVPQLLEQIAGGPCGRAAPVRDVFDSWSAGQLGREDSPEVDNQ